jgi:metabolite-proton symporter
MAASSDTAGGGTAAIPLSRIAVASFIGTAIEFYDFYIYGTAAALIFSGAFFPQLSDAAALLASLSTFAVAFLSRPIGSVLFGHWGDRIGRKSMLIASLLLMGLSTFAIGLLPGYAAIGIAAPLLLVSLRFLQGIGLGGEWGGAALLAAEHAPPGKRGFYALFPQLGAPAGFILANLLFLLLDVTVSNEAFASWGWRIPFLLSIALVGIGLYVRVRIAETPVFEQAMQNKQQAKVPFVDLLSGQWRELLLGSGIMVIQYALFYTATTYLLAYGSDVGIARSTMLALTLVGMVALAVCVFISGRLSDRIGRRRTLLVFTAVAVPWGLVIFPLMDSGSVFAAALAVTMSLAIMGLTYGPMGAFLPELFHTRYRYSGAAFSYSLGGILGGALPPLIATQLQTTALGSFAVGLLIAGLALVSLLCVGVVAETADRALLGSDQPSASTG